jgi:hypothetical protein
VTNAIANFLMMIHPHFELRLVQRTPSGPVAGTEPCLR